MFNLLETSIITANNVDNTWGRVSSCKHYFPCDEIVSGNIQDIKGSVYAAPQDTYTFEFDTTLKAVRSTATSSAARQLLASGEWSNFESGKSAIFFTAGYLYDSGDKTLRTSIGDTAFTAGWGMSDSIHGAGVAGHNIMNVQPWDASHSSGSVINPSASSLFETVEAATSSTGYFFRYAIYRPDGAQMEGKTYNGTTGALIAASNSVYIGSAVLPTMQMDPYFRMNGYKSRGIALFYFDTIPADYLTAMITMAAEWKKGNRFIWPYWP